MAERGREQHEDTATAGDGLWPHVCHTGVECGRRGLLLSSGHLDGLQTWSHGPKVFWGGWTLVFVRHPSWNCVLWRFLGVRWVAEQGEPLADPPRVPPELPARSMQEALRGPWVAPTGAPLTPVHGPHRLWRRWLTVLSRDPGPGATPPRRTLHLRQKPLRSAAWTRPHCRGGGACRTAAGVPNATSKDPPDNQGNSRKARPLSAAWSRAPTAGHGQRSLDLPVSRPIRSVCGRPSMAVPPALPPKTGKSSVLGSGPAVEEMLVPAPSRVCDWLTRGRALCSPCGPPSHQPSASTPPQEDIGDLAAAGEVAVDIVGLRGGPARAVVVGVCGYLDARSPPWELAQPPPAGDFPGGTERGPAPLLGVWLQNTCIMLSRVSPSPLTPSTPSLHSRSPPGCWP